MAEQKKTRRDFLRGKASAETPSTEQNDRNRGGGDARSAKMQRAADATADPYLVRIGRRAMACQFQVFVNAGQFPQAMEVAVEALDHVEALEQMLTVYRNDSEISWVNQTGHDGPVEVGLDAFAVLQHAIELYAATDGAFDVTSGGLSELWGRARRSGRLPRPSEITAALQRIGSQFLELDASQQSVRLLRPGVQINLGGIGKGYALDEASQIVTDAGVTDFLFHGGKSSVLARGNRAGEPLGKGWSVGLVHPLRPDQRLAEIFVRNRALSTSGSQTQSFHFEGRRFGHILDPRTGRPAEGVLSTSVLAPTAAEADALSTALFVMGPKRAAETCRTRPDIAAIVVTPGPRQGSIEIETHNLSDSDWAPDASELDQKPGRTVCADSSSV